MPVVEHLGHLHRGLGRGGGLACLQLVERTLDELIEGLRLEGSLPRVVGRSRGGG